MKTYKVAVVTSLSIALLFFGGCSLPGGGTSDRVLNAEYYDMVTSCYSAAGFSDKAVTKDELNKVLKAGLKAPSAQNAQPWHFTAVTKQDTKEKIVSGLSAGSALIIVSAPIVNQTNGGDSNLESGLAAESMYIAAQALGLGAHLYTAPVNTVNDSLKEELRIPEDYEAYVILAVGHIENLADSISGASPRSNLSDFVTYID